MGQRRAKRHGANVFALMLSALLLASCATTSPFKNSDETYAEALGEEGNYVLTLNFEVAPEITDPLIEQSSLKAVLERAERANVALNEDGYYGALEGNYPKWLVNTALSSSEGFEKEEGGYYRSEAAGIEAGIPERGLVIFSSTSYEEALVKTWSERISFIPREVARKMSDAYLSFYINKPKSAVELGTALPSALIMQTDVAHLLINKAEDGSFSMDASFLMKDEKTAKSLNTVFRTEYISSLRRENEEFDLAALRPKFSLDGATLSLMDLPITASMAENYTKMALSGLL